TPWAWICPGFWRSTCRRWSVEAPTGIPPERRPTNPMTVFVPLLGSTLPGKRTPGRGRLPQSLKRRPLRPALPRTEAGCPDLRRPPVRLIPLSWRGHRNEPVQRLSASEGKSDRERSVERFKGPGTRTHRAHIIRDQKATADG